MSFRLDIDLPRWIDHLSTTWAAVPGLVPVIKGNGYGVGRTELARAAAKLGAGVVAVGVPTEVADVRAGYSGDILVMEPLRPHQSEAGFFQPRSSADALGDRLIRTVSRLDVLAEVTARHRTNDYTAPRFVVEVDSPMHRHGITWDRLGQVRDLLDGVPFEGIAVHLPMVGSGLATGSAVVSALAEAGIKAPQLWLSHLPTADLPTLASAAAPTVVRPRVGTALWLGDRGALQASGEVLDIHPIRRGQRLGYWQWRAPGTGQILVVSGGTGHGIGLRSPSVGSGLVRRARNLATGVAHGAGLSPSPFHWAGRRLRFADSPHMQVSMLFLPASVRPPQIGDRLSADVRLTATTFDLLEYTEPR